MKNKKSLSTLKNDLFAQSKGFRNFSDYAKHLSEKKGLTVAQDRNLKAIEEGYKSYSDKLDHYAKHKGFESNMDMLKYRLEQKIGIPHKQKHIKERGQGIESKIKSIHTLNNDRLAQLRGYKNHSEYVKSLAAKKQSNIKEILEQKRYPQKILSPSKEKNRSVICETLEFIIKDHPDIINEVLIDHTPSKQKRIKEKINKECKSKLLSELLD